MIIFDPIKHAYTNSFTGDPYISVTTLLGQFKPEFDADKFSRIVADRKGVSQQSILDEWKTNNKAAQDYGTHLHKVIEEYAKTGVYDDKDTDIIKAYQNIGDFNVKGGTLFETCVFNHEYKVAGTADIIHPNGAYFDVYDFKTNKKFNYFSKYEKFLFDPLSHLPECEYTAYSLQLSTYAYFYHLMTGRKPRSLKILYWEREAKQFISIPVIYMLNDVKRILNHARA
jgi:hypothetical protein